MKFALIAAAIMFAVTIIPRIIPITFFTKKVKNRYVKSFFYYMPSAIISAMVFPSIFYSTGNVATASVGTAVALVMSFFKKIPFFVVAIVSVLVVFGVSFIL
ncbi:MAG: AzlD domain-containing protein [Clostridia bacterium]|nr:AzlD domain-containing protein [Clostridia bacterium]